MNKGVFTPLQDSIYLFLSVCVWLVYIRHSEESLQPSMDSICCLKCGGLSKILSVLLNYRSKQSV